MLCASNPQQCDVVVRRFDPNLHRKLSNDATRLKLKVNAIKNGSRKAKQKQKTATETETKQTQRKLHKS